MRGAGRADTPVNPSVRPEARNRPDRLAQRRDMLEGNRPHFVTWSLRVAAALAVTAPATVRAAEVPEQARGVIAHYVEATGGRKALETPHVVHVKGRIRSMGMSGTFEQWTQPPDRILSDVRLGSLHMCTGYDGETGWTTDLTSKAVTLLDGKDLEALQSDAYFENEGWARKDPGNLSVRMGSVSYAAGGARRALTMTPPVGPPRTLWFNLETGLVDRVVHQRDHQRASEWTGRYRKIGARRIPTFSGAAPPGDDDADDAKSKVDGMTVDSWTVDEPRPASFFAPPESHAPVRWVKATKRLTVPFRYGSHHVWIRASINGAAPADFILDTGASMTAIDRGYAQTIGLAREGQMAVTGVSGTGEGSFARVRSVRIADRKGGSIAVRDLRVALVDLGEEMAAVMWRRPAGLIGSDVLRRFAVEIDYDAGTVTFHDPDGYAHDGPSKGIPMGLAGGVPTVQATLDDDCEGTFLVDVGNGLDILVHGSATRRCHLLDAVDEGHKVEVYSGGIGGAALTWVCRMNRIRVGDVEMSEPVVMLGLATRGIMGSQDYAGNIGSRFLEHYHCTFDYADHLLYLDPGRRADERPEFSRSGFVLAKVGESVLPTQIVRGSPADKAGLRLGDRVETIDGKVAASLSPEELDRLFLESDVGTKRTLKVLREGRTRKITIELHEVL